MVERVSDLVRTRRMPLSSLEELILTLQFAPKGIEGGQTNFSNAVRYTIDPRFGSRNEGRDAIDG